MRSTFFRDVIYPIWFIIFFIFTLGYCLSSKGDTSSISSNLVEYIKVLETNGMYGTSYNVYLDKSETNLSSGDITFIERMQSKIDRLEKVVNSKPDLRKAYHGGSPTIHFETNLETRIIQRLDKYPDGYIHIEKGAERKILTAEESAKRIVKRKNIKNYRIEGLKTRIATLEKASDAQSKAHLEQCKRLLERMERTSTTNYVDVVVTPQKKQN